MKNCSPAPERTSGLTNRERRTGQLPKGRMMDFIFITGPSAVGKTTLAKELYRHCGGVYIEQNMVPEFIIPDDAEDVGAFEEQLCWENVLLQIRFFHEKGFRNIVVLDFDDIRAREIPLLFRGYDFVMVKLISGDPEQITRQMIRRQENEGGLFAPGKVERSNAVIRDRKPLPNEITVDILGKTAEEVLAEVIRRIDGFHPAGHYDYEPESERHFLSWVKSRGLS